MSFRDNLYHKVEQPAAMVSDSGSGIRSQAWVSLLGDDFEGGGFRRGVGF